MEIQTDRQMASEQARVSGDRKELNEESDWTFVVMFFFYSFVADWNMNSILYKRVDKISNFNKFFSEQIRKKNE